MASANFFSDAASAAASTRPPAVPTATSSMNFTGPELNTIFSAARTNAATYVEITKDKKSTTCRVWLSRASVDVAPPAAQALAKAQEVPQHAAAPSRTDAPAATGPRRSNSKRSPASKSHSDRRQRERRGDLERAVHTAERVARFAEVALRVHV